MHKVGIISRYCRYYIGIYMVLKCSLVLILAACTHNANVGYNESVGENNTTETTIMGHL